METMICNSCGAKLVPTTLTPFLTCAYCDTSIPNPHYDAVAAATVAAEKPALAATCLAVLKEMGTAQNLIALDRSCFGNPLTGVDSARAGLSIPDDQQVYFLYEHTFLFIAFSDGLALTDQGLYYNCNDGQGSLSWETFITAPISCTDQTDGQDGTLKIGSCVVLPVKDEKDSCLVRFLVDFHNRVYQQHTGDAAPAAWAVTEPRITAAAREAEGGSLLGSVLPGVGALVGSAILGNNTARRTTARTRTILHTPTVHPASHPTVRKDRREHISPPRPLMVPNHPRPSRPAPAGPGSFRQPGRVDAQRRPAISARPGSANVPRQPGASGRPGGMGPQRRPGSKSSPGPRKPGGRR